MQNKVLDEKKEKNEKPSKKRKIQENPPELHSNSAKRPRRQSDIIQQINYSSGMEKEENCVKNLQVLRPAKMTKPGEFDDEEKIPLEKDDGIHSQEMEKEREENNSSMMERNKDEAEEDNKTENEELVPGNPLG